MSLTNTEQCMGAGNSTSSRKGSRNTQRSDRNGNRGNSRFANSSSAGEAKDNRISQLSITKDGPRSIQLTKILESIPLICQYHHYDYISDIISTNIEPTQEEFLSDLSIKRQSLPKHHVKLGIVDPIIGLDLPSGNVLIKFEMVEMTPISNTNPQVSHHSIRSEGTSSRSHEWDKHIVDKKSIMTFILSQCDETSGGEMTLGQSPRYDVMPAGLLKFIKQLGKVCIASRNKNIFFGSTISMITEQHFRSPPESKNVFFGLSISKFTEHHIRPTTRVKKLLDAHPGDDCMWMNTDPCNVSLDDTSESEEPVNTTMTTTSIRSEDDSNVTHESIGTTP